MWGDSLPQRRRSQGSTWVPTAQQGLVEAHRRLVLPSLHFRASWIPPSSLQKCHRWRYSPSSSARSLLSWLRLCLLRCRPNCASDFRLLTAFLVYDPSLLIPVSLDASPWTQALEKQRDDEYFSLESEFLIRVGEGWGLTIELALEGVFLKVFFAFLGSLAIAHIRSTVLWW